MAHEVDKMAYAIEGGVPWHGLGSQVKKGSSIDEWRVAAGLTWTAELAEVACKTNGSWEYAEQYRAVYRSDNGHLFSVVSHQYKPVQPQQILEFFRDLAGSHGLEVETCGSLRKGAIVWALATNKNAVKIGGVDVIKPYLLISTSYDTTKATRGAWTAVRVVCRNTIQMAWDSEDKGGVAVVRHNTTFNEDAIKIKLGLMEEKFAEFEANANLLAAKKISAKDTDDLLIDWFGSKKEDTGKLTTNSQNVIDEIKRLIASAPGQNLPTARGTAWGVLNGVTRYVDFSARTHNADNRLTSAWFGHGNSMKLKIAKDLLKV